MSFNKVENTPPDGQNYGDGSNMCLELALEGERLCKAGDCQAGIAFFQAAIQAGTDDLRTLSAVYSQLGNAYFYLGDYAKAVQYHKHDLTLAKSMGDKLGEAKSSGNLGNALKVMGKFDEAVICCQRHLEISRELNDKLGEGRALYNLGNVYHAKGKHLGHIGRQNCGEYTEEGQSCLTQAIKYYQENLNLMKELGDIAAQGRACGNLGNTNYLLGNLHEAIRFHEERLKIARNFGDKAAERRAHSNLGNSHIFLSEFEKAAEHYKETLNLAIFLQDKAVEGQACYSLGNTYTLLRDYPRAIEYHLRHYVIAQQLFDRVGEARACWSLGNAYAELENNVSALHFAEEHLRIAEELDDSDGQATAHVNIENLKKLLGIESQDLSSESTKLVAVTLTQDQLSPGIRRYRVRRKSMEHLDLIKLTPDRKQEKCANIVESPLNNLASKNFKTAESDQTEKDSFFDLLSQFQSKRMDDQRCSLNLTNGPKKQNDKNESVKPAKNDTISNDVRDDLLDLIMGIQSKRMDEQRVELPNLPGLCRPGVNSNSRQPDAATINPRLHLDARCEAIAVDFDDEERATSATKKSTVPDDDLFALISGLQSCRMDDQRAKLKKCV